MKNTEIKNTNEIIKTLYIKTHGMQLNSTHRTFIALNAYIKKEERLQN